MEASSLGGEFSNSQIRHLEQVPRAQAQGTGLAIHTRNMLKICFCLKNILLQEIKHLYLISLPLLPLLQVLILPVFMCSSRFFLGIHKSEFLLIDPSIYNMNRIILCTLFYYLICSLNVWEVFPWYVQLYHIFNSCIGVPWWLSGLRIQHGHCRGSSCCCGAGLIPGLGTSACRE